ncbi:hypothetical protein BDV39DRAFT_199379 [Aspergillus sergii]|uniref:Uncharacterized protein n=1 Tax=Aspergillus sergii TaxID=1034303 RepID=A0A5N6XLP4_9EURO|nr:hypothetical protein BDV39DRAFT_199379 [Aspergillus sergii]
MAPKPDYVLVRDYLNNNRSLPGKSGSTSTITSAWSSSDITPIQISLQQIPT